MTSENPPIEEDREPAISQRPIKPNSDYQDATSDEFLEDLPPIEERFGMETVDTIADGLLVRAPLDQVCELLAQSGTRWERDVYSQTIYGCGLVVYQFRGHAWTNILDGSMTFKYDDMLKRYVPNDWNWESQAQSLSQQLHTRTIHYWVDDAAWAIGYAYWENGRLMEHLEANEDESETDEDSDDEDLEEGPLRPHLFESQLRPLTAPEIDDAYEFTWNFLREQKAYALTAFHPSDFQRDDFVRIDYIAFAPATTSNEFLAEDLPPIEERYGIEPLSTNAVGLLVHAPLDQVCELLAQSGTRWERDVYDQTIHGCGLIIYQFRGHAWTGILDGYRTYKYDDMLTGYVPNQWDWELQAQSLSQQLHTRTIYYEVSGNSCTLSYTYWENGRLMERLKFHESETEDDDDEEEDWRNESAVTFKPYLFESQLRPLTASEIDDAYEFTWNFLREQKAYAVTELRASDFQRDDFVRVDYIAFA